MKFSAATPRQDSSNTMYIILYIPHCWWVVEGSLVSLKITEHKPIAGYVLMWLRKTYTPQSYVRIVRHIVTVLSTLTPHCLAISFQFLPENFFPSLISLASSCFVQGNLFTLGLTVLIHLWRQSAGVFNDLNYKCMRTPESKEKVKHCTLYILHLIETYLCSVCSCA